MSKVEYFTRFNYCRSTSVPELLQHFYKTCRLKGEVRNFKQGKCHLNYNGKRCHIKHSLYFVMYRLQGDTVHNSKPIAKHNLSFHFLLPQTALNWSLRSLRGGWSRFDRRVHILEQACYISLPSVTYNLVNLKAFSLLNDPLFVSLMSYTAGDRMNYNGQETQSFGFPQMKLCCLQLPSGILNCPIKVIISIQAWPFGRKTNGFKRHFKMLFGFVFERSPSRISIESPAAPTELRRGYCLPLKATMNSVHFFPKHVQLIQHYSFSKRYTTEETDTASL